MSTAGIGYTSAPVIHLPRSLPDVTLVAIDAVACELTALAIRETLALIEPADLVIWTDRRSKWPADLRGHCRSIELDSLEDVARALWYGPAREVKTSHFLAIQWDGWVVDAAAWQESWLDLDYIGAPWPQHATMPVGNGGFSLRSTKLSRALVASGLPVRIPEDEALCRDYRNGYLAALRWATLAEARDFSYERTEPRSTFGFHGAWNLRHALGGEKLKELIRLGDSNAYVRGKPEWRELAVAAL